MNKTLRAALLAGAVPAALAAMPDASGAPAPLPSAKPNIIYILADDLGWADVGFNQGIVPTPNIDKLAREGVIIKQHYVAPVCTPTRAALMSGRYWSRFGVYGVSALQSLPFDTFTLPRAMKAAGYNTALIGKWHLGSKPDWGPNKFGFDYSYGSLGGGTGPWDHRYKEGVYSHTWHRNCELITEEGHVTDLLANEAVKYISGNDGTPFFLYIPFTAVHLPVKEPGHWVEAVSPEVVKEMVERYGELKDTQPDCFRAGKDAPTTPELAREYAACLMHLDHEIGRIVETLEKTGIRKNTIIVFGSDNGAAIGAQNNDTSYPGGQGYAPGGIPGSTHPLHGWKTMVYEGGIRTPAFVNWPGVLAPRVMTQPASITDWMPTFCALLNVPLPQKDLKWDGINLWPFITGEKTADEERIIYTATKDRALRVGDWKLIQIGEGKDASKILLYNLAEDPNEKKNLAAAMPDKVAGMQRKLRNAAKNDNDSVVGKGSKPDKASNDGQPPKKQKKSGEQD